MALYWLPNIAFKLSMDINFSRLTGTVLITCMYIQVHSMCINFAEADSKKILNDVSIVSGAVY